MAVDLIYLANLLTGAARTLGTWGKDGKQVQAFYDDWNDAFNASTLEERQALAAVGLFLASKLPRRFSWDPFKPMRIAADDVARQLDFKRYKALRGIV